jgi:hypothetical protein
MQGRRFVYTIFTLTLIWTFVTTHVTLTRAFAPDRAEDERLVNAIHSRDTRPFSVVSFLCCMQTRMASANMHIIDYYYGWHMRGTPHYYKGDEIDLTAFNTYRSTYVIAPHHLNLTEYDYEVYWQNVVFVVWRTDTPNIFPLNL